MNERLKEIGKHQVKTAILVDGGFYRKRAKYLYGNKSPKERADELTQYCYKHLHDQYEHRYLYRIFYYDCPPSDKNLYNPITQRNEHLKKSEEYSWMNDFLDELKHRRKFALRLGRLSESQLTYYINPEATKKLLKRSLSVDELTQQIFLLILNRRVLICE